MLFEHEASSHARAVAEAVGGVALEGVGPDEDTTQYRSDVVVGVASLLRSAPRRQRMDSLPLKGEHRCACVWPVSGRG